MTENMAKPVPHVAMQIIKILTSQPDMEDICIYVE
jgi:hypothetical protein